MIKIIQSTIFLFTLLIGFSVQSQDTLLVELFDDSTLGQFIEFSEVGDGEKWRAADFDQRFFATMNGFNGGIQDNVDWLISPGIDMNMYEDEILTFEHASNFDGPELELLISVDYSGSGDPSTATWTDLSASAIWSPGGYEYVFSGDIDLSSISGTAYIAFKYTSSQDLDGKNHQVDQIVVSATQLSTDIKDVEASQIITTPIVKNDNLSFSVLDLSTEVSIATIDGEILSNLSNISVKGNVLIPLSELPNGIYVLIAKNEGSMKSFKFVR